jgi:hypothetical protein
MHETNGLIDEAVGLSGDFMPALFGYLCALCLLLGGGYGALSWLAAPETAHVVTKTPKSKQRSHEAQAAVPTAAAISSSPDHDTVLSSSINLSALPEAEPSLPEVDLVVRSKAAEAVPTQQTQNASGEVLAGKAKRTGERAFSVAGTHKKSDGPRSQRVTHRSERKLVLMTLRTIKFSDGRQVTQLIPYRGRERVLASSLNE